MKYNKVTDETIRRLKDIVGDENILSEHLMDYGHDETHVLDWVPPEVVVKPKRRIEVSEILKMANQEIIPVTPRGGGTGLSGGAVPIYGGIVLSLERMNKILEIDEDNFLAVVEPGVTLAELYKAVEDRGLYYPVYPEEESATIGGNVATNAAGMKAVKYGVTRNYIMGLEAVLPNGAVIETGGKYVKNSTGYNLTQLLVGSEGTLAVVTRIILKLIKRPKNRCYLIPTFESLEDAISTVPRILKEGIVPVAIEFMSGIAMQLCQNYTGIKLPIPEAANYLIVIIESDSETELTNLTKRVNAICLDNGASDVFIVDTEKDMKKVSDVRAKLHFAVKSLGLEDIGDAVVPRNKIPEFINMLGEITQKHGILVSGSGHAGDGNVHFSVIAFGTPEEEFNRKLPEILTDVFKGSVSLGGTISGEHGIGVTKKKYVPIAIKQEQIELMGKIKRVFDPNYILNPGKIFD
ncbi:MAG: FAD-linked oxidase C-terminal domain-containing protein [Dehalococcoidia bacterium]